MSLFAISLLLHSAFVGANVQTYESAFSEANESGKPLVVLVGADWCPACQTMKQRVLPSMRRQGKLDGVSFAVVNTDRDSAIARQLMKGGSIPQLVVFSKASDGWKRMQLTGAQSESQVEAIIRQAKELQTQADTAAAPVSTVR